MSGSGRSKGAGVFSDTRYCTVLFPVPVCCSAASRSARFLSAFPRLFLLALLCLAVLLASCDDLKRDKKEKSGSAEIRDDCLRLAVQADEGGMSRWEDYFGWMFVSNQLYEYERECEQKELRGCLLPTEENSKVEEYKYRKRRCQSKGDDCGVLSARIGELQGQKPAMQQRKNQLCKWLKEQKNTHDVREDSGERHPSEDDKQACRYAFRRIEALIDAIAVNEINFEERCYQ